jgi:hypothetical protein
MSRKRPESRLIAAIADWRRRSIDLSVRLRSSATDPDAWLFRIHLRILHFLLLRYDRNTAETVEPHEPDVVEQSEFVDVGPLQSAEGRPPRTREEIRAVLLRIAVANGGGSWSRPLIRAA